MSEHLPDPPFEPFLCDGCGRPAAVATRPKNPIACLCGRVHEFTHRGVVSTGESDPTLHDAREAAEAAALEKQHVEEIEKHAGTCGAPKAEG